MLHSLRRPIPTRAVFVTDSFASSGIARFLDQHNVGIIRVFWANNAHPNRAVGFAAAFSCERKMILDRKYARTSVDEGFVLHVS